MYVEGSIKTERGLIGIPAKFSNFLSRVLFEPVTIYHISFAVPPDLGYRQQHERMTYAALYDFQVN